MRFEEWIEPWWREQSGLVAGCFTDGVLDPDFLTYCDPASDWPDPLWARFGITPRYFEHWADQWADIAHLADVRVLKDPEFGGLAGWRDHEWLRGEAGPDMPLSPPVIRHAWALIWNLAANRVDLRDLRSVVHWGGGCGLQTLILRWLGCTHTEYLIDLPIMGDVQRGFLTANGVPVADGFEDGKINIVPLDRVDEVPQGHDLFIALHSLSESTPAGQDYVDGRGWFDAERLVLEWTEGIDLFGGTEHWERLAARLVKEGRVLSREAMRIPMPPRLMWEGAT
ncbi:MAG: hypothetical protein V4515_14830 [Chloroflexota bacterium]